VAAHAQTSDEQGVLYLPLGSDGKALATWRSVCLVSRGWAAALRSIPLALDMAPLA